MEWVWAEDYWIARLLLLRCVGAVYLIGFIVVVNEFRPLLGSNLQPAPTFLRRVSFRDAPSLFHWRYSDRLLLAVGWVGIALSSALWPVSSSRRRCGCRCWSGWCCGRCTCRS